MRIYADFNIESFGAWSGAVDTKENIIKAEKADLFNSLVDDIFPDGCTETQMNDFLWFEDSYIYELLGLNEDGEEPDEEDEETPDLSGFDNFEAFCESFMSTCDGCPFAHVVGECEKHFTEAKEAASHE